MSKIISQEAIESFLNGHDPEPYIVGIEYDYQNNLIYKIIQHPEKGKLIIQDKVTPFLWVGDLADLNFYNSNKSLQKKKMSEFGIIIEKLETGDNDRLVNGLKYLVKSIKGYTSLINFFKHGGIDPWSDKYKEHFQILSIQEQFLIQSQKRLFKGFEDYNDIHRLVFDIETTGLNPEDSRIILIGLKDNRGYKKIIEAFDENGERNAIIKFFNELKELKPSVIGGYNSASFDFPFILKRAEILDIDIKNLSNILVDKGIKIKEGSLKLGGEVEKYNQFVMWGISNIDISHSVRRAQAINSEIKSWSLKYITKYLEKEKPNRVYVDGKSISTIYLENESYYLNPKTGNYKKIGTPGTEGLLDKYPGKFEIWTGSQIVDQYLDDDLYETMLVDDSFSQSTFLLSKVIPTTYERITTMGTATLWKVLMLAWSYENNLAVPKKGDKRKITGGLSRLLNVGYSKNVVKFDYSSLYPSIQLVYDVFPECDIMGVQKSMLKYFRNIRIQYKGLAGKYKDTNMILSEMYDRKQLPIKIFINAYFGSLSAPKVFPWGDMNKGETITCTGRQFLRMMIMFFKKKGYKALVMDTDGVNFEMPTDVENRRYIGKGNNELVEKDKLYTGVEADTAEFNDIFMRGEMGLDIDYIAPACINISRKNYIIKILKKGKEKIKLTGNTIKSKKLATYIADFLDEGLIYLLNNEGDKFIELYYNTIDKLYNKQIPLIKIANKSRVKQTVDDYHLHCKKVTKSGAAMSRQAHMELVIKNNYTPSLGETIYYVNNGTKKSDGDVQKITKPTKKFKKEFLETYGYEVPSDYIKINSYMITEKEINENPDMLGDYNIERYIHAFNTRITPLLVVFNPNIREDILINDPKDRQFFTKKQCELVSGYPLTEKGQDDFNEVMTLSDTEVEFWKNIGLDPYFMYVEDSINEVDSYWVDHNRKVLIDLENSVKEEVSEEDEYDLEFPYHASIT